MKKPSEIFDKLETDGKNIMRVKVGGKAIIADEFEIEI